MNDKKIIENYKNRMKRQNEAIKEKYDRISCTLPKGTKEAIAQRGKTVNGLINELVAQYLEQTPIK